MKINRKLKTVDLTVDEINNLPVGCPSPNLPSGHMFLSNRLNGTMGEMGKKGACTFFKVIEVDEIKT